RFPRQRLPHKRQHTDQEPRDPRVDRALQGYRDDGSPPTFELLARHAAMLQTEQQKPAEVDEERMSRREKWIDRTGIQTRKADTGEKKTATGHSDEITRDSNGSAAAHRLFARSCNSPSRRRNWRRVNSRLQMTCSRRGMSPVSTVISFRNRSS